MSALTKPSVVPTHSEYKVASCWRTLATVTSGIGGAVVSAGFLQAECTTAIAAIKIPATMYRADRGITELRFELIAIMLFQRATRINDRSDRPGRRRELSSSARDWRQTRVHSACADATASRR